MDDFKIKWKNKLFEYIGMSFECPICGREAVTDDYIPDGEYLGSEDLGRACLEGGSNWMEYYKCKNCGKRYCFMDSNW